jgi:hypothetical protein
MMNTTNLTIPQVGLIAMTRAVLGVGVGLLIHDKLHTQQRNAIGWTCLTLGLLTTIPLAIQLFGEAHK